jgi:hypothetical protein
LPSIENNNRTHSPKKSRTCLLLAIAGMGIVLILRIAILFLSRDSFVNDPDAYRSLAVGLKTSGVFGNSVGSPIMPTAFRPPLYPWLLSFGVNEDNRTLSFVFLAGIHSVLGVATCFGTAYLLHFLLKMTLPQVSRSLWIVGVFASTWIVAIDPILIRQSQLIMTETLATFLSVVSLVCCLRFLQAQSQQAHLLWAIGTGLAFGLNSLCRPTAIAWLALVLVCVVLLSRHLQFPSRTIFCLVLGFAVCVVPWGIRNSKFCGKFVLTTTHGGYTLLLANNPSLYDHLAHSWSRNWDESSFSADWNRQSSAAGSEIEQDLLARNMAFKTIRERPLSFAKSCVARLVWLWAPWPNQGGVFTRAGIGAWYFAVYAAAVVGFANLIRTFRSTPNTTRYWLPLLTLILSVSMVHSVFWSNMRMRAVCVPAVSILASLGVVATLRPRHGSKDAVCSVESML